MARISVMVLCACIIAVGAFVPASAYVGAKGTFDTYSTAHAFRAVVPRRATWGDRRQQCTHSTELRSRSTGPPCLTPGGSRSANRLPWAAALRRCIRRGPFHAPHPDVHPRRVVRLAMLRPLAGPWGVRRPTSAPCDGISERMIPRRAFIDPGSSAHSRDVPSGWLPEIMDAHFFCFFPLWPRFFLDLRSRSLRSGRGSGTLIR
jgi:hypothetical protein